MKAIKSDSKVGGNLCLLSFSLLISFWPIIFFHSTAFSDASFCNDPIHSMEFMYIHIYIYMYVCILFTFTQMGVSENDCCWCRS